MAKIEGHHCSSLVDVTRNMRGEEEQILTDLRKCTPSGRALSREDRSRDYVNATELQLSTF